MIPRPLISTLFPYTTLFRSKILLVGVDLKRNTFIHGIEEWVDIPGRVTDGHEDLITVLPDGTEILVPSRRHYGLSWSEHYWKVEKILAEKGAIEYGKLGDADEIGRASCRERV